MALDVQQVARMAVTGGAPEMVEADVVKRGRTGEAGDVAAQVAGAAVGAHHHRHRVPAQDAADLPLKAGVARHGRLQVWRDGVDVLGGGLERQHRPSPPRHLDHALQQLVGALRAVVREHGVHRLDPFLGFGRIEVGVEDVLQRIHEASRWLARGASSGAVGQRIRAASLAHRPNRTLPYRGS
jgi:hypothetical protein